MLVKIELNSRTNRRIELQDGDDKDHIFILIDNEGDAIVSEVSIEEIKHALRKLSCK